MGESKLDVLPGTLDLMILKTLQSMGPLHGYRIARRIEQVSGSALSLTRGRLSGAATTATARMDQGGMGHVGDWTPG
jgi:hypothetical protein